MVAFASSTAEFDALLADNKYVLVDFMADWCPPCKAIAPFYEKLAASHAVPGQFAFAKVNIDNVPDVASRYGITAIPTFLVFEKGQQYAVDIASAGKTAGPGASVKDGKVELVRSADPRSLTAISEVLSTLAKDAAPAAAAADDGTTVSGGYTLGSQGGKRADWKTSLN